jgi:NADPH2:quinone reductase
LARLGELGADATIQLDQAAEALKEAYLSETGDAGFDVILDYLWGEPTEALLAAITKSEFAPTGKEARLVQVGESAGATIKLPAAVLRSTAVTILGTAGIPPREVLFDAMREVMKRGAMGELRIETERVALAEVESAWKRAGQAGRRTVLAP